eukprot:g10619.t1
MALLSPWEQALGFHPSCNVRRDSSTTVITLHNRHDDEERFSLQDGSTPAEDERSSAPLSLPAAKTSRRRLASDALLLGEAGAGAILAWPLQTAARDKGQSGSASSGDGLALALALPAVGPRTKRIFLARHGETDLNKLEVCQGRRLNPPLNEKGRGQARALLTGTELSAILSSPLRRARETAGIVRESHPLTARFSVTEDLNEVDFGDAEGLPKPLAAAVLAPAYFSWSTGEGQGLDRRAGRVGENGLALRRRAKAAAGTLLASCEEGGQVLGVSHSSMIKFTLATLLDVPLGTIRTLGQDNCAVNALDFDADSGVFEAVAVNGRPARGRAGRFGRVGAGAT